MQAHKIHTSEIGPAQLGWSVTESVRTAGGRRLLPKGGRIDELVLADWSGVEPGDLHLIELEPGDLHEDEAGRRVSEAVTGAGVVVEGPFHSRYNLNAKHKGLLRVDLEAIRAINAVGDLALFSLFDRQTVPTGKTVAGVKATPIVVEEAEVIEIERIAREADGPVIDVLPFKPKRVFVIATEDLHERLRDRFVEMVRHKIEWYGSELVDVLFIDAEPEAVAAAFEDGLERGAEVFMAAGGNTLDPLDPIFLSLEKVGAEMVHFGAPADPGSMFWVAAVEEKPIFNLASCSMYSQATVIDLMLPLTIAGLQVSSEDVIDLGYGGLLEKEMAFRFPDYEME